MMKPHTLNFARKLSTAAMLVLLAADVRNLKAQFVTPVSAVASSFYSADQDPVNLINGSGLVGSGTNLLTYTANADSSAHGMWHSDGSSVSNTWVAFDLGADNFTLTAMDIWQMNQPGNLGRGVKDFAVYTASTTNVADATNFVGDFSLAIGTGANGEPVQHIAISATGVRLVEFAIIDDWNGFTNDYVGLAEVRFEGSVPHVVIVTQPQNTTNLLGESHTFTVTASGPPPLSYQWYQSPATAIPGATNASYAVGLVNAESTAGYYVVVANSNGSVTSSVANLTVVDAYPITPVTDTASSYYDAQRSPINLINGSGQSGPNEIFNQTANADPNAAGMWHTDGTAVNGAWVAFDLGTQYTLSSADIWQMNQTGILGRGVKDFAMYTSPTTNIADATNLVGDFSLAEGTGVNGEPVQRLTLSNSVSNVRLVEFVITDDWNGADPDYVGLSEVRFEGMAPAVAITSQPLSTTNLLGESHTFSVTAAGPQPLSYQWYQPPGTAIPGATNASYAVGLVNAGSAASYYVVVTNSTSSVTSSVVNLTVVSAYPVTPVSDSASSFYSFDQAPINLINGNGQSGPNEIFNQTANADGNAHGMWHTDGTAVNGAWVAFDLGTQYTLTSVDIWQMNQPGNLGRGVKDFGLFTSSTTNISDATNFVGDFSLAEGGGANGEPVQRLTLSNSVPNVRLAEFVIIDDWNGADPDYTGLSEVRFEAQHLAPHFTAFGVTGGALSLSAQGGIANGSWVLLQSTNIASPRGQWQAIASGAFDASGSFSTNLSNTATPQSFFILKVQ
jgi:hypothetical protein